MNNPTIGMIGSHSAEEIALAAKLQGLKTLVFCQKGREKLYTKYNDFLFDHILVLENFNDILFDMHTNHLHELNTIIIPNRSLSAYLGYDELEKWDLPIYGNRYMQRIEDRNFAKNQYWLMDQIGMRKPLQFTKSDIPGLGIVKIQQKEKPLERAFFYVSSTKEFELKSKQLIKDNIISEKELETAIIEEFILGPRFNANYHAFSNTEIFSPGYEFVGFDDRVQTNLQGYLNLPAKDQLNLNQPLTNEEVGHKGITIRESKKQLIYEAAEQFLEGAKKHFPPGMIGMFALQGAINNQNEFIVFDISPRVPGSPVLGPTSPEFSRLSLKYGIQLKNPLEFSMIEIKYCINNNMIDNLYT